MGERSYVADAMPDVFDGRDLDYRARLQPLPPSRDRSSENRFVREQQGNSCTGHALAAAIDAIVADRQPPLRVSAQMLYWFARRYDEFEGETDVGSSLRGVLKAWLRHGALSEDDWVGEDEAELALRLECDADLQNRAMECPLGAFYRVNAEYLDDVQSAIDELSGVIASAAIHEGWLAPVAMELGDTTLHVIARADEHRDIGGHAFALVGYNQLGFQVQNSWGADWGKDGFATLPYDDWLDSAYDAWVARPGVPRRASQRGRQTTVVGSGTARRVVQAGADQQRLIAHVVNLGNDGALSATGGFESNPAQVDRIFASMDAQHQEWGNTRHVVLYAHGGLTDETSGLGIASKHLDWWMRNEVYPITFAWETGVQETLTNILADRFRGMLPFGWSPASLLDDAVERLDRLVENAARTIARPLWDQMKSNAAKAAEPAGGATAAVERLVTYARTHAPVQVHIVGHSAGAIFVTGVLRQLADAQVPVTSVAYLAPAIRTDDFLTDVIPALQAGERPRRFASFALTDKAELDDVCTAGGTTFYRKSLLYLVSRALERASSADGQTTTEVPLVGMQHFATTPVSGSTLTDAVDGMGGDLVWAPSAAPVNSRSSCISHGGFDDDSETMTSVLRRMLHQERVVPYQQ